MKLRCGSALNKSLWMHMRTIVIWWVICNWFWRCRFLERRDVEEIKVQMGSTLFVSSVEEDQNLFEHFSFLMRVELQMKSHLNSNVFICSFTRIKELKCSKRFWFSSSEGGPKKNVIYIKLLMLECIYGKI